MDVTTVTAVTAATAQPAAAPGTMDAVFGALLQSMTDTAPAQAAAVPFANIARLLTNTMPPQITQDGADETVPLTVNTPAQLPLDQLGTKQDASASVQTPAPIVPSFDPASTAPQPNTAPQPDTAPQPNAAPQQTATTVEQIPAPQPDAPQQTATAGQTPVPQPASLQPSTPSAPQPATQPQPAPQPVSQPLAQQDVRQAVDQLVPEPVAQPVAQDAAHTDTQPAVQSEPAEHAETQAAQPTVADTVLAAMPQQPAAPQTPVKTAPGNSGMKDKSAVETQTKDSKETDQAAADNNSVIDVLAGFLLAQIAPAVVPANDTAPDADGAVSPVPDRQDAPAKQQPQTAADTPQPPIPPVAPAAASAVPAPAAPVQPSGPQIAAVGSDPPAKNSRPAPFIDTDAAETQSGGDTTKSAVPHVAAKSEPSQTVAAQVQPAPTQKPDPQQQPETKTSVQPPSEARTPAEPAPAVSTAQAAVPAQHQAPNAVPIANPVPTAPHSGLRKLTAGLQIVAQQQDAAATLDKLGIAIATRMVEGTRQFDIRLDPPELGRVEVRLTMDDTGKAHANLVVDKPQTLELLQRDAPNLNRALSDAGLDLSNNGLNFSLREQYRQNDGGVDQGRGRSLSAKVVVQTDAAPIHSSLGSYAPNSVRLDIRV